MSGVIIRCSNCGTTQSALGECEACHEVDTRYFCTNHEPGRWLDGRACAACGAEYGTKPVSSRPAPERVPVDVGSGPIGRPGRGDVFEIEPAGVELPERRTGPLLPADGLTLAATASGCVRRFILLFLILLVLAALAIFGLLGGGIRLL